MTESTPRFGFVAFAETWNGRLAMMGFVIGLGTELLTGQSIAAQLGLGLSPWALVVVLTGMTTYVLNSPSVPTSKF